MNEIKNPKVLAFAAVALALGGGSGTALTTLLQPAEPNAVAEKVELEKRLAGFVPRDEYSTELGRFADRLVAVENGVTASAVALKRLPAIESKLDRLIERSE